LFSREVLVPGEDAELFAQVAEGLEAEFRPVGEVEHLLVDELKATLWRRRRLIGAEAALFKRRLEWIERPKQESGRQSELPPIAQAVVADQTLLANLHRYEARLGRSFYQALHELQRRQAARAGELVPPPVVVDVNVTEEPDR
jgi:hypothetical protein